MHKKENNDPITMMNSLIEKKRNASIAKFRKGDQDLKFEQVLALGSNYTKLAEGVFAKIEKKVSEAYFIIRCKMEDLAELLLHLHSDYDEDFEVLEGFLFDKHGNVRINKKTSHTFKKGTWHNIVSFGESEMLIHCRRA